MINVMIIGSGAREHAIARAFDKSRKVENIFLFPGNDGIAMDFNCVELLTNAHLVEFINQQNIDLVFVGNEQPLAEGLVDYLKAHHVAVVGPTQSAARIESSKIFAKNLMKKYGIPTAGFETFHDIDSCLSYLKGVTYPQVIKADGLAAGKGVVICESFEEAEEAVVSMMQDEKYGSAGLQIVVEEFMEGEEASIFAFSDGESFISTIFCQDHKQVFDGDKGPNTGGMGAFAPVNKFSHLKDQVDQTIFKPVLEAMVREGCPFEGVLYAGLMMTKEGPKVVEFNCRLGDPETQVLLPLLQTDFYDICQAIIQKRIKEIQLKWRAKYAVTVVAASQGYPGVFEKGFELHIPDTLLNKEDLHLYYSGVRHSQGEKEISLKTNGGRVMCVTALKDTLQESIQYVYENIKMIQFENIYYRQDIGKKGLRD